MFLQLLIHRHRELGRGAVRTGGDQKNLQVVKEQREIGENERRAREIEADKANEATGNMGKGADREANA